MASARFTPLALNDLKEIRDFIAKDKSGIASQYMTMLKQKCELLASSPGLGVQREELKNLKYYPHKYIHVFWIPAVHAGMTRHL